jgi:hypothetical protein
MALRLYGAAFVAALVLGVALAGSPGSASAHERRVVGNYLFVVGWTGEPAIADQPNAMSLEITLFPNGVPENAGTEATEGQDLGGTPVEGAEKTLKASITTGGAAQTKELTLQPKFGTPGTYQGQVIPAIAGDYAFIVTGTLDGTPVNETFESGPDTFDSVEDPATLEFPTAASPTPAPSSNSSDDSDNTVPIVISIVAVVLAAAAGGIGLYAVSKARSA